MEMGESSREIKTIQRIRDQQMPSPSKAILQTLIPMRVFYRQYSIFETHFNVLDAAVIAIDTYLHAVASYIIHLNNL